MKREQMKTTIAEVVDYWSSRESECGLSVDFSEAHELCWRCGYRRKLQRCHIIPHALGGSDAPENLVLLCGRCHQEAPNVTDPQIMWDWLRAYAVSFYDTFWILMGYQEYQKIYKVSFEEEIKRRGLTEDQLERFKSHLKKSVENSTRHFGDPFVNPATVAGTLRMTLKDWDEAKKVEGCDGQSAMRE